MRLIKSLALLSLGLIALKAHAIDQIYNWNGLEFVRSGNAHHVHPASPQSTVLRGGWVLDISDVEPKASASHAMPYKNSSNALVTVKPQIDPSKVSSRVAQGLKNAAAGAATTGNGYVALGALACGLFDCAEAVSALIDWGVDQLRQDGDSLGIESPSPDYVISTGTYRIDYGSGNTFIGYSPNHVCESYSNRQKSFNPGYSSWQNWFDGNRCHVQFVTRLGGNISTSWPFTKINSSVIPTCSYTKGIDCFADAPLVTTPISEYLQSNYTGKGWNHHWAKMTAAIVASGGNVFTDGTSTDITGPAIVPVSTSEAKTSVSLVPGTTNPAPAGHTGPTESGTQTTTTTTTAHNKFNPAPMTSGSSGSPASGPSMETTQKTTTTTSITNNVTNITNIVNEMTTEKDEAPEEAPTDTPFADLPELYKQKYPDGLIGVLRTQTAAMKATPLFQLPTQLMGDLPQTGQCPSWQIDLSLSSWASFGTYNVGADCAIWDFAGWVIVISASLLALRLIFGG